MIDDRTAFKDMLPTFPTMHLTTERHHWGMFIRLHTASSGAPKSFILFQFVFPQNITLVELLFKFYTIPI